MVPSRYRMDAANELLPPICVVAALKCGRSALLWWTMTIDWSIGSIMARPGLELTTRELILIALCVTMGHAMPQVHAHVEAAL